MSRDSNFSKLHMLPQGIGPVKAQRLRLRYLSSLNCPMVRGNGRFRGSSVHDRSIPRTTASSHLIPDQPACTKKNIYLWSYIYILVELLSSRSLWFLGPASHLFARTVHIQRGGRLNKQAIQVYFIESEVRKNLEVSL